jgi:ABC-type nickel/cobalt efflux system permease component RcnA
MDTSLPVALGLGFLLGLRHAMDGDHVAAVSSLVSEHRSLARSCLLGAFWGVGHTTALLAAGVAILGLRLIIPPEVERALEMVVACVLIFLGGRVLLRSLGIVAVHSHAHVHGDQAHRHVHFHRGAAHGHDHADILHMGRRPFLLGILHGLAGSAALALLVVAAMPSALGGFLYIVVFGAGSTAGMLLLSGLIGVPFAVTAGRSPRALALLQSAAGTASVILGLVLAAKVVTVS